MSETKHSGGIGFVGILQIVFITLKLLEKIDWSWVWVLSPIWISTCILISAIICILIVTIIFALYI